MDTTVAQETTSNALLEALKIFPALGAPYPGHDGVFAGLSTAADGTFYPLVKLNAKPPKRQSWKEQMAWAESLGAVLADRVDGALMRVTIPALMPDDWIWLGEPYGAGNAWYQDSYGGQGIGTKAAKGGGLAVRRLVL